MTQTGRNGIKMLAEQAKKRLARNARVSMGVASQGYGMVTKVRYMQERVLLSNEEDEVLYEKLKAILLENETVTNPLGQLIDQNKFKMMNAIERDAYIVKMVDKFHKLQQRWEKEQASASILKIS